MSAGYKITDGDGWHRYSVNYSENVGTTRRFFVCKNTGDGSVRIYQIVNVETGEGVYFDYTIEPGEEVIFVTGEEEE